MTPTPTAAARVSGTIKALEWEPDSIAAPLNAISTHNGFCRWVIVFHFTGPNTLVYRLVVGGRAKDFGTLAAAKAAAQADYEARILAAIQPDPEPQQVAWQFRAMENGQPRTGWHMAGTNDHAGWIELVRRDATCSIEDRPLFATPSSAGMVSVEAAARVLLAARNPDGMTVMPESVRDMLRALAGEGGR